MGVPMQIATRMLYHTVCVSVVGKWGLMYTVELVAFGLSKFSASAFNLESQPELSKP